MSRRAARKARRAARHQAAATLLPPEGVPITLPIAGVGVRLGAQILDVVLTVLAAGAILLLLSVLELTRPQSLGAVALLLFFIIRIPYYVITELVWNGQTLGKRFLAIKVVSHDGGPLTTHAVVMRNIMKEAEIFLPGTLVLSLTASSPFATLLSVAWIVMAFAIPSLNVHRQRLGDMLAGTHVIHIPQPVFLKDLARAEPASIAIKKGPEFTFLSHQLDHYGAFELQTLEKVLRADGPAKSPDAHSRREATLTAIVDRIRTKIAYADPVPVQRAEAFLRAFYNAQRAHLEQRQLFGDKRADKFHGRPADSDP